MIDRRTLGQIVRFVVAGGIATLADLSVYTALLATILPDATGLSKTLSFVVGTTVAFVLNKYWTFGDHRRDHAQTARFVALYGVAWAVNVGANEVSLAVLATSPLPAAAWLPVAFVVATGCSMVLNFLGQRLWVFRGA
ncbi:MAG: GtrA family protein [Alphaproteobacteria bacterium]|nr:GtrA family protein [Alphaproteobacteria bacterium]